MSVTIQPVRIDTGSPDEEGCLMYIDGRLAAVLVRLSEQHGPKAGQWFYEIGFGPFADPTHPLFADVAAAETWVEARSNRLDGVTVS